MNINVANNSVENQDSMLESQIVNDVKEFSNPKTEQIEWTIENPFQWFNDLAVGEITDKKVISKINSDLTKRLTVMKSDNKNKNEYDDIDAFFENINNATVYKNDDTKCEIKKDNWDYLIWEIQNNDLVKVTIKLRDAKEYSIEDVWTPEDIYGSPFGTGWLALLKKTKPTLEEQKTILKLVMPEKEINENYTNISVISADSKKIVVNYTFDNQKYQHTLTNNTEKGTMEYKNEKI